MGGVKPDEMKTLMIPVVLQQRNDRMQKLNMKTGVRQTHVADKFKAC